MNRLKKRRIQVPILKLPSASPTPVSGSESYLCSFAYPINCQMHVVITVRIKVLRQMTNRMKKG